MTDKTTQHDIASPVGLARLAFVDRWLFAARSLFARSALKREDAVVLLLDVGEPMGETIVGWHERIEPRGRIAERIVDARIYLAILCLPIARRVFSGQPVVLEMISTRPSPGKVRLAVGTASGWLTMMVPVVPPPAEPDA